MLIVCPSCATSYNVGLASLSPDGRDVRCARCRTVWHAELSPSEKLVSAAAAIAPPHDAAEQGASARLSASEPATEVAGAVPSDAALSSGSGLSVVEGDNSWSATDAESSFSDAGNAATEVQAPPIAPGDAEDNEPPIDVTAEDSVEQTGEPAEDIETVAARRQRRSAKRGASRWPLTQLQTAIMLLALIDVILVSWRSDIVRALPQTASFYASLGLPVNLRGLAFSDVVTSTEQHEGVPILVVGGNIINSTRKPVDVPRLKFVVRNAARQEIYSWTAVPSRNVLQPGEGVSFRARLASPPPDARDIVLRFLNRSDIIPGMH